MLTSSDRFARQNRDDPPPGVSQASAWASIVHHLSGSMHRTPLANELAVREPATGTGPTRCTHVRRRGALASLRRRRFERRCLARYKRLHGPCYKTGRIGASSAARPNARRDLIRGLARPSRQHDLATLGASSCRLPPMKARLPIRFRRNDFTVCFTLSSESFSTFPRGTVSALSESRCD